MSRLRGIPEVAALESRRTIVRIPPGVDVPLTARVRKLIDSATFHRLSHIRQLGLVSHVYPAAQHTRFEHSLGVFRMALLYLQRLSHDPRFAKVVDVPDAERFLVAALFHDIGHWPFCHPIEDLCLPEIPPHEKLAQLHLNAEDVADTLRNDWHLQPDDVVSLLKDPRPDQVSQVLHSLLSSPIDIDKMDYLARDSLHAGVPYGQFFDQNRLIGSLCLNRAGNGLALSEKGKTAAELMVFARYVMFSEVYWHHVVRAATAMMQRAFWMTWQDLDLTRLYMLGEPEWIAAMRSAAEGSPAGDLLAGIFGRARRLYKRVAQYSLVEHPDLYERIARKPYRWLFGLSERFAEQIGRALGRTLSAQQFLFDAPPIEREIEFKVEIHFAKTGDYRMLSEVSPVVRALAREQFDDYVKRVRVFVHPEIASEVRALPDIPSLLHRAVDEIESNPA